MQCVGLERLLWGELVGVFLVVGELSRAESSASSLVAQVSLGLTL
jgi:hypothetical protein